MRFSEGQRIVITILLAAIAALFTVFVLIEPAPAAPNYVAQVKQILSNAKVDYDRKLGKIDRRLKVLEAGHLSKIKP